MRLGNLIPTKAKLVLIVNLIGNQSCLEFPQESILGPLLFVLYVNDIPTYLSCPTEMFPDDTVIHNHCSPSSISDSVQSGLKQVEVCKKKKQLRFGATHGYWELMQKNVSV